MTHGISESKPTFDRADVKQRKCLDCGEDFKSDWNGNRICSDCKRLTQHTSASME